MHTRKIYGVPLAVARKVNQIVDNSTNRVVEIALERLHIKVRQEELRKEYGVNEDWHKHHVVSGPNARGCGCIYCRMLAKYVNTKIAAHRLRRRLDNLDWAMQSTDVPAGLDQLLALEREWPRLREQKNQIKLELGM